LKTDLIGLEIGLGVSGSNLKSFTTTQQQQQQQQQQQPWTPSGDGSVFLHTRQIKEDHVN
jgi:hypothetical protein